MKRPAFILLIVSAALAASALGQAGPAADLIGNWTLTATAQLANGAQQPTGEVVGNCLFEGTATITRQQGSDFQGSASLNLSPQSPLQPPDCPEDLAANVSGTVTGNSINMAMLMGGDLGTGSFSGTIGSANMQKNDTGSPSLAVVPSRTIRGTFSIQTGPWTGVSGSWGGTFAAFLREVPTLSNLGLLLLALLLVAMAWTALKRPKSA